MLLIIAACILVLLILFVIVPLILSRKPDDSETYIDKDGDHKYYERSIIKKKEYFKEHPEENQKEIRSIRNLIRKIASLHKK